MKQVTIIRADADPRYGTFGMVLIEGEAFGSSLEPYHRSNMNSTSSIPAGQYLCKRYSSKKYPNTYEITDVGGRTKILFHGGNIVRDTLGCVIIGQYFGNLRENRAILNSGKTFKKFMEAMDDADSFRLTIKECY